jgi:hypothetical protein
VLKKLADQHGLAILLIHHLRKETADDVVNGKCRVEYICKTYMRHGKDTCASHRIREEKLDQIVQDDMSRRRDAAAQELVKINQIQKRRALKEPVLHARRLSLEKRVAELEQEIDDILMEKIQCKS